MTKIEELYEQEIQEAVSQARQADAIKYSICLIELGCDNDFVMRIMGLTLNEVRYLRGEIPFQELS
jgi:hypothetical protein